METFDRIFGILIVAEINILVKIDYTTPFKLCPMTMIRVYSRPMKFIATSNPREAYYQTLQDYRWTMLRQSILHRDGNRCRNCKSANNLQVHHRQYHTCRRTGGIRPAWNYPQSLLVTLCEQCHAAGHQRFTIHILSI